MDGHGCEISQNAFSDYHTCNIVEGENLHQGESPTNAITKKYLLVRGFLHKAQKDKKSAL